MADQFDFWRKVLADPSKIGSPELSLSEGEVHSGYWRSKKRDGSGWQAVGIWRVGDQNFLAIDGKLSRQAAYSIFSYACRHPIPYDLYVKVTHGEPWPDLPPALSGATKEGGDATDTTHNGPTTSKSETVPAGPPPAGIPAADREVSRADNQPPEAFQDTPEGKKAQLAEEQQLAAAFLKAPITTQELANKAANWADRVAKLGRWFGDEYERLNRPLLTEQKRIRALYLEPEKDATALAKTLTSAQTDFLWETEQKRVRQLKAAADAAEAERRAEIEKVALESGPEAALKVSLETPVAPPPGAPAKVRSGGATGRATTITTERVARVTDYFMLAAFLISGGMEGTPRDVCHNPELKALLDKLSHRMAQTAISGHTQPGFTVEDKPKARR